MEENLKAKEHTYVLSNEEWIRHNVDALMNSLSLFTANMTEEEIKRGDEIVRELANKEDLPGLLKEYLFKVIGNPKDDDELANNLKIELYGITKRFKEILETILPNPETLEYYDNSCKVYLYNSYLEQTQTFAKEYKKLQDKCNNFVVAPVVNYIASQYKVDKEEELKIEKIFRLLEKSEEINEDFLKFLIDKIGESAIYVFLKRLFFLLLDEPDMLLEEEKEIIKIYKKFFVDYGKVIDK